MFGLQIDQGDTELIVWPDTLKSRMILKNDPPGGTLMPGDTKIIELEVEVLPGQEIGVSVEEFQETGHNK